MRLEKGNMFNIFTDNDVLCVTTNGVVNKKGELVMGAGVAKEIKEQYPEVPKALGELVNKNGNIPHFVGAKSYNCIPFFLVSFPTKNDYRGKSDLKLIENSAKSLVEFVNANEEKFKFEKIRIPAPGIGNGKLKWEDVRKVIEPIFKDDRYVIHFLNDIPSEKETKVETKGGDSMPKVLECSSKGDKRFSAMYAMVDGKSIEQHYQESKVFLNSLTGEYVTFTDIKSVKIAQKDINFKLTYMLFNGKFYDLKMLTPYYAYLWAKYFLENPNLLEVIKEYDTFTDMFKGENTKNCQADVIAFIKNNGVKPIIESFNLIPKTFAIIVAGSRTFNNLNEMTKVLDHMLSNKVKEGYKITIISGTANGADTLGEKYAEMRGYEVKRMPADWNLGKRAGYLRNEQMALESLKYDSQGCVCFRVNNSNGTSHMIDLCGKHKVRVLVRDYTL